MGSTTCKEIGKENQNWWRELLISLHAFLRKVLNVFALHLPKPLIYNTQVGSEIIYSLFFLLWLFKGGYQYMTKRPNFTAMTERDSSLWTGMRVLKESIEKTVWKDLSSLWKIICNKCISVLRVPEGSPGGLLSANLSRGHFIHLSNSTCQ